MIKYAKRNKKTRSKIMAENNRKVLGVRISYELHKAIKQVALDNDVTTQDYVVGLIIEDIKKKTGKDFKEN